MPHQDSNPEKHIEDQIAKTLAERVKAIQERARREGFVSGGSDDKPIMDEAWGENELAIDIVSWGARECEMQRRSSSCHYVGNDLK